MNTLVFVDMLGVKSRWLKLGKQGAESAFKIFNRLVNDSIKQSRVKLLSGFLEADATALSFSNEQDACYFARTLYFNAFFAAKSDKDERIWLRGAIVSLNDLNPLRTDTDLDTGIKLYGYSDRLLEAVQVEKSGFKGMRIVIEKSLLTSQVRSGLKTTISNKEFFPVRKLTYAPLPKSIGEKYEDFVWMAAGDTKQFENAHVAMSNRLRWCCPETGDEFIHAAATQVVFNECRSITQYR